MLSSLFFLTTTLYRNHIYCEDKTRGWVSIETISIVQIRLGVGSHKFLPITKGVVFTIYGDQVGGVILCFAC